MSAPVDPSAARARSGITTEQARLPHQRFHDLRHASATLGLESGESLYEVNQRLGHANIATTGDIYSHVTPAMQERSAARMDRILTG